MAHSSTTPSIAASLSTMTRGPTSATCTMHQASTCRREMSLTWIKAAYRLLSQTLSHAPRPMYPSWLSSASQSRFASSPVQANHGTFNDLQLLKDCRCQVRRYLTSIALCRLCSIPPESLLEESTHQHSLRSSKDMLYLPSTRQPTPRPRPVLREV